MTRTDPTLTPALSPALCGGAAIRAQRASLAHSAHVVVGTPGRILDHLASMGWAPSPRTSVSRARR